MSHTRTLKQVGRKTARPFNQQLSGSSGFTGSYIPNGDGITTSIAHINTNVNSTGGYYISPVAGTVTIGNQYISYNYSKIELLGEIFETSVDNITKSNLAQIDYHGISFYKSLKKMSVEICDEKITKFLDSKLISWERGQRIKKIIDEK